MTAFNIPNIWQYPVRNPAPVSDEDALFLKPTTDRIAP